MLFFIRAPSTGGLHPQPKILGAMLGGGEPRPRSPFFGQNVDLKYSFFSRMTTVRLQTTHNVKSITKMPRKLHGGGIAFALNCMCQTKMPEEP